MKLFVLAVYTLSLVFFISGCTVSKSGPMPPNPPKPQAALAAEDAKAEGSKKLPGNLVFDKEDDPKNSKYAGYVGGQDTVPFDHKQHVKYEGSTCVVCHHTNSTKLAATGDDASEFVMKCTNCHNDKKGEMTPSPFEGTHETLKFKGKPSPEAQIAYHGENGAAGDAGCVTCHKKLKGKFPNLAKTIGCSDCHNGGGQ